MLISPKYELIPYFRDRELTSHGPEQSHASPKHNYNEYTNSKRNYLFGQSQPNKFYEKKNDVTNVYNAKLGIIPIEENMKGVWVDTYA
ncbi:MAG: hypothetical protein HQK79_12980 [Desulfobacterales bacterium]|nr:hypothetical protein [Desulfobacterales bacterium]MBF0398078.1 hypothetical protein [Desulfobacterales bacterium]